MVIAGAQVGEVEADGVDPRRKHASASLCLWTEVFYPLFIEETFKERELTAVIL